MGRDKKYHKPINDSFVNVLSAIGNENRPEVKITARPFLKWVGGKRSILQELVKRVPEDYTSYNEPFLGGGALFFELQPEVAKLSDINFHLIITFRAVQNDIENLIKHLKVHEAKHCKEYYLKARKKLSTEQDLTKIACLFIYINKK